MRLVVASAGIAIVRQVAVLASAEESDAAVSSSDGVVAVGILEVTVGIIVEDISQGFPVRIIEFAVSIATDGLACTEIIAVEIVSYASISEIIIGIIGLDFAIHIIYLMDRRSRIRSILETAMVSAIRGRAVGGNLSA